MAHGKAPRDGARRASESIQLGGSNVFHNSPERPTRAIAVMAAGLVIALVASPADARVYMREARR